MAYASLAQFSWHGLRLDAFVWQPRQVAIDVAASKFILPGHGLFDADAVRFVVLGAGGALPAELSPSSLYPVTRHASDVFSVGVALTGAGTGPIGIAVDHEPKIVSGIELWAQWIDAHLAAYRGPLSPAPGICTLMNCHLAAYDLAVVKGLANPQYKDSAEDLRRRADRAQKLLDGFAEGKPLAGSVVDQTPSVVEGGAIGWSETPRGWDDGGLR